MSQSYLSEYQSKLTTPEKAVSIIRNGDWVDYGWNVGMPEILDRALAERMPLLHDIKVRGGNILRLPEIFQIENPAEHFCWNSIHMSGIERRYCSADLTYYVPIRYSELPGYYDLIEPNDVMMIQVAPMDAQGYFNFGPNCSHLMAASQHSKVIIVEVNEKMPYCPGGYYESIHISQVDMIVEGEHEDLPVLSSKDPGDTDVAIAKLIFEEIPDGACLQLGIGNTPNAVGSMIADSDLKDLGVQTEMYVDAFMKLTKAGKITNARKPFDTGRSSFAFAAGSKELYEFLDHNPAVMSAPVNYTNDISRIASIDDFISINSAVNVDLFGQIGAETAGLKHISGAGGQLDFVMGAYLSKGGKSFICIPAVRKNKDGSLSSNIVPTMPQGTVTTDTRANTHFIVTEFGKVNLKGKSTWERAELLISVAHPDFREDLIKEAQKMHIWRKSNRR